VLDRPTNIAKADRETVIRNLLSGQYSNALRVVVLIGHSMVPSE
jgi:hypothetical protein